MITVTNDYRYKAKEALGKADKMVSYAVSSFIYEELSKINDINIFNERINSLKNNELYEFEEGIIYLTEFIKKEKLKDYEIIFLEKYHQYLANILNIDPRYYCNNLYCKALVLKALELDTDEFMKINNKTTDEIYDILSVNCDLIMQKIHDGEELDNIDKNFLEELFLLIAYSSGVIKEYNNEKCLMYDVVTYFNKYPISDLSNPKNIKFSILYFLATKMLKEKENCAIIFSNEYTAEKENSIKTAGFYTKTSEGIHLIRINGLDSYDLSNIDDFLNRIFIVFHELQHLRQECDNGSLKEILEFEKVLIENCHDFYDKYHDSFYIEIDADNYACSQLIELYQKDYEEAVNKIVNRQIKRKIKRIPWSKFFQMELEEYKKIKTNKESNNKII